MTFFLENCGHTSKSITKLNSTANARERFLPSNQNELRVAFFFTVLDHVGLSGAAMRSPTVQKCRVLAGKSNFLKSTFHFRRCRSKSASQPI
jgi:hypothetical protein